MRGGVFLLKSERWVSLIAGLIALVGTVKSIFLLFKGVLPNGFWDYCLIGITLICYLVVIYLLFRPNPIRYDFVPNLDDIEHQAKLIRASKKVRFRGLRFYEALNNHHFVNSLKFPKEIQLHIMARFSSPITTYEEDHNNKLLEIQNIVLKLRKDGVNIVLRESNGCPDYNELIFDKNIVRRNKYDKELMSAKNSEVETFHWERANYQIKKIIKNFDKEWESAFHR